jgi:hypothetical protein
MGSSSRNRSSGGQSSGNVYTTAATTQQKAAPQMGTITSDIMPRENEALAAPISYYKNQAEIPVGQMGLVRPNEAAIGVNRVVGVAPTSATRNSLASMLVNPNPGSNSVYGATYNNRGSYSPNSNRYADAGYGRGGRHD